MPKRIDQATIDHWHETCERMNSDDHENYVPLWDVDYWAEQIHNLTDEQDYEHARAIAQAVSEVRIVNQ